MAKFPHIPGVRFGTVADYPEYAISDDGRIWNGRGRRWQIVPTFPTEGGEQAVHLQRYASDSRSGSRRFMVSALIAAAFEPPAPEGVA